MTKTGSSIQSESAYLMASGAAAEQLRRPVKPNLNKFIGQFEKVSS